MLASLLGIRLVLWLGKTVPLPAPASVMTALTKVEVNTGVEGKDGFQMTFTLGKDKSLDYSLLAGGALDPDTRVVLGVVLGVTPEPLIDGVIYHHQITPSAEPGMSTLTVSGRDISVLLDLDEKNEKYENQPDASIVSTVVSRYAQYGIVPQAKPTTDVPLMTQRIPRQQETDLAFLRRLAKRNGFVFYIEPLTLGTSIAYWGPENRAGIPQSALKFNMGGASNVQSIYAANDALAPVGATGSFVEPMSKMSIKIPPLPSPKFPPLERSPATPRRTRLLRKTANQDAAQAANSLLAAMSGADDPVSVTGTLDTTRYGNVLRARRIVGVGGIGKLYDGDYYVNQVKHVIEIKEGKYMQEFKLNRGGTGALLPVVRP